MATLQGALSLLEDEQWYTGRTSDQEVKRQLQTENRQGKFLVRDSPESTADYILSVRNGSAVKNYPIIAYPDNKCLVNGFKFLNLDSAIEFYSDNQLDGVRLIKPERPLADLKHNPQLGPPISFIRDSKMDATPDTDSNTTVVMAEVHPQPTPKVEVHQEADYNVTRRLSSMSSRGDISKRGSSASLEALLREKVHQDTNLLSKSPAISYSTFKPPATPSPDCVSPSPNPSSLDSSFSSNAHSILDIWPTRRSFVEARASIRAESEVELSSEDCTVSGNSDTELSEDENDTIQEPTPLHYKVKTSDSTLTEGLPTLAKKDMEEDREEDSVFVSKETPGSSSTPVRRKVIAPLSCSSDNLGPTSERRGPQLLGNTEPSLSKSVELIPKQMSVDKQRLSSFKDIQEQLNSSLSLRTVENSVYKRPQKLTPIPCQFIETEDKSIGLNSSPFPNSATENNRYSFVFSSPSSYKSSPSKSQDQDKPRPKSAVLNLTPTTPKRKRSFRRSVSSAISFIFRKSSTKKEKTKATPPPSYKETAVTPTQFTEMQKKYSTITHHSWESDSLVYLNAK